MELQLETLRKSEQVAYLLRRIYEQYGYRKFRMSKFEEYDFYTENRDFLRSAQIITFTDLSGKLMALKPDVTMSIVKNTRATQDMPEKLYYTESVYRMSREVREYKEIFQIGLEYIGEVTPYTNVELVSLAKKSLACIEDDYVLDISHMGFLTGLMDSVDAPADAKKAFLSCIESKNAHELTELIERYGVDAATGQRLVALTKFCGDMGSALTEARALIVNDAMRAAVDELQSLYDVFASDGDASSLRLDFSITSDSKYYNGLMFRGYVKSVPRAVLSGGRYDHLLRRMGKPELQAIGFALYFDEVERYLKLPVLIGYDAVVLYDDAVDLYALHRAVERLTGEGKRVCAARTLPADADGAKLYRLCGTELAEVEAW
ncbi:MAG: ATP phosphoribosyltransferase regulatory subunit [Bacillota bacterium]